MTEPRPTPKTSSLLAIDVGSINTRAVLFDAVEGRYRFLASGTAPTTANPPMSDASEGVRLAMDTLTQISGRVLTTPDEQLIIPSTPDGSGADNLAATLSAGAPLKTVVVGLLDKVSLASARNLVNTTYTEIIETISLNDGRQIENQLDNILKLRPDLVVIAGGTTNGASHSVFKMVNAIGLALYLIPEINRPQVLYAGNPNLVEQIGTFMEPLAMLNVAPNIRPSLSKEQLGPALSKLNDIFARINSQRTLGINELNMWSGGHLIPTSHAMGRVIRFFSQIIPEPESRGVLGVDIGSSAVTVAAAFNGDLRLRAFNDLGMGTGLTKILESSHLGDITRWIPFDLPSNYVVDYIQNKVIYPQTLPMTQADMAIEQALAREVIRMAVKQAEPSFPKDAPRIDPDMLPSFDPIVVSGSVIANAPTSTESLLMILDALQPTGIQQIILDKNNLTAALGASVPINPTMVTQLLLDPISFLNLGFVISPVSRAKEGSQVLRVRIAYETGHENVVTAHQGTIQKIPLALGQRARLFLDPLQRANIGAGPGRSISGRSVVGGPFGIVIDARGRPLDLPESSEKRRANLQRWFYSLDRNS